MLENKKRTEGIAMPYNAAKMLEEVIRGLGHDPKIITVEDLQGIADKLSYLVGKTPAWGWRYLRNILNGKLEASHKLLDATLRLGATIDSTPEEIAMSERVVVQAVGHVRAGALVLADSRPCANPGCRMEFVPRTPNQACHSKECAKILGRIRRRERKEREERKFTTAPLRVDEASSAESTEKKNRGVKK